jgi:hypothetical protein
MESTVFFMYECKRCGWKWLPRQMHPPKTCPKCRAITWNRDKEDRKGLKNGRNETIWKERLKKE